MYRQLNMNSKYHMCKTLRSCIDSLTPLTGIRHLLSPQVSTTFNPDDVSDVVHQPYQPQNAVVDDCSAERQKAYGTARGLAVSRCSNPCRCGITGARFGCDQDLSRRALESRRAAVVAARCSQQRRYDPLITAASLKEYSRRDLAEMAKRRGVSGWHTMCKEQLVRALTRLRVMASRAKALSAQKSAKSAPRNGANGSNVASSAKPAVRSSAKPAVRSSAKPPAKPPATRQVAGKAETASRSAPVRSRKKTPRVLRQIEEVHAQRERFKDLATGTLPPQDPASAGAKRNGGIRVNRTVKRDRLALMVRDSYWLHAYWEISRQSVERVRVAMAEAWHTARPILRLLEVETGSTTNTAERVLREIPIHGGVNNWYIDVQNPPSSFRVAIGYLSVSGKFHTMARSNSVTTPCLGASDALDQNWTDVARDCERIYAMSGGYNDEPAAGDLKELFEERLRRPMGSPLGSQYGSGAGGVLPRLCGFHFDVDAELIIYGQTRGDAHVTIAGQPVKLRPDGSFTVRQSMPDRRQVLPVVAGSRDGLEQRTVILAIERNTKVMEPVTREVSE